MINQDVKKILEKYFLLREENSLLSDFQKYDVTSFKKHPDIANGYIINEDNKDYVVVRRPKTDKYDFNRETWFVKKNNSWVRHREKGPAFIDYDRQIYKWYLYDELSRDDGPAWIQKDPSSNQYIIKWYKGGLIHKDDGPAIVFPDGEKQWAKYGLRHREDGPAVIRPDGTEEYYKNGNLLSKKEIEKIKYLNSLPRELRDEFGDELFSN